MSAYNDPYPDLITRCFRAREASTYIPVQREITRIHKAIHQLDQRLSYYSSMRPFISIGDLEATTKIVEEYEAECQAAYEKALASLHDEDRALIEKARSLADHLA